jgi:hypothetical protein
MLIVTSHLESFILNEKIIFFMVIIFYDFSKHLQAFLPLVLFYVTIASIAQFSLHYERYVSNFYSKILKLIATLSLRDKTVANNVSLNSGND